MAATNETIATVAPTIVESERSFLINSMLTFFNEKVTIFQTHELITIL